MPYLTGAEIATHLAARFPDLAEVTVGDGDAEIASAELDGSGPFIGSRLSDDQELAFPRDTKPNGDENTDETVPAAPLDWVALNAYRITTNDEPGVKSYSRDGVSETFVSPMLSIIERRMERLLSPYLASGHMSVGVDSTFDSNSASWSIPWP